MRALATLLLVAIALPSCSLFGPSASGVSFETDAEVYASGDTIVASLSNSSGDSIGYNLCFPTMEVLRDEWERIPGLLGNPGGPCADILFIMKPGGAAEASFAVPPDAESGSYRLRSGVTKDDRERIDVLAPFEVR